MFDQTIYFTYLGLLYWELGHKGTPEDHGENI
jgi:hypothetical protein